MSAKLCAEIMILMNINDKHPPCISLNVAFLSSFHCSYRYDESDTKIKMSEDEYDTMESAGMRKYFWVNIASPDDALFITSMIHFDEWSVWHPSWKFITLSAREIESPDQWNVIDNVRHEMKECRSREYSSHWNLTLPNNDDDCSVVMMRASYALSVYFNFAYIFWACLELWRENEKLKIESLKPIFPSYFSFCSRFVVKLAYAHLPFN